MLRNIFIVYPCYMGGHHLANMISTDAQFSNRIKNDSYDNLEINAHVHDKNIGQLHSQSQDYIANNIDSIASRSNVFNCHIGSFLSFKARGLLDAFPNKSYITIHFPQDSSLDSLFRKRAFLHHDMAYYDYRYYYYEFKSHHAHDVMERTIDNKTLPIVSDYIFTNDPINYVNIINFNLNLNLDYNLVNVLHQKWYKKVLDVVADLPEPPMSSQIIT